MQSGHHEGEVHHHKNKHLLERFEGYTDLIVVGLIIALGAAMLIGLAAWLLGYTLIMVLSGVPLLQPK